MQIFDLFDTISTLRHSVFDRKSARDNNNLEVHLYKTLHNHWMFSGNHFHKTKQKEYSTIGINTNILQSLCFCVAAAIVAHEYK